jgi:DNA-binding transcriptional ArsR family regulator
MLKEARLDNTLLALADPTRRAILDRLSRGEARVTEVAEPFSISLNSVSKHIQILERADLVRRRRVGRDHFLSINSRPVDEQEWCYEPGEKYRRAGISALCPFCGARV